MFSFFFFFFFLPIYFFLCLFLFFHFSKFSSLFPLFFLSKTNELNKSLAESSGFQSTHREGVTKKERLQRRAKENLIKGLNWKACE